MHTRTKIVRTIPKENRNQIKKLFVKYTEEYTVSVGKLFALKVFSDAQASMGGTINMLVNISTPVVTNLRVIFQFSERYVSV